MLGLGGAAGCLARPDPGVIFKGWSYEPDLVQENIDFFEKQTNVKVAFEAVSGNYHDKMVPLFIGKTPLDCCYVRDDHLAEWVAAGWLRPFDDLPGAGNNNDDIFAYNLDAMSYGGKSYGLPYYTDFLIWVYNENVLRRAGFDKPARTLDELTEQARKIKADRISAPGGNVIEYPLIFSFRQLDIGLNDWWALNYASEVRLFDDQLDPIFPDDKGRRCERVLQWLVDGIHEHDIIAPTSLNMGYRPVLESVASGRQAFALIIKYDLEWVTNRKNSALAEADLRDKGLTTQQASHSKVLKMAPIPSLEPGQSGTLGWTRMYSLASHVREEKLTQAWELMNFLGGKDASGDYYTARRWFGLKGLGFAFKSLMDDPEIIEQTQQWGDIELIKEQARSVRARENIKAPWFSDFNIYYQPIIQKILLKQQSPRDGLARIAKRCRELKREWS